MTQYGLTKRQYALLQFIRKFKNDNGYSPSFREMRDGLGRGSVEQYQ